MIKPREKMVNHLKIHDKCFPRCATREQYRHWRSIHPTAGVAGFCEDCTPEFKHEKSLKGLCDYPEVLFYLDSDDLIYGSFGINDKKTALTWKEK